MSIWDDASAAIDAEFSDPTPVIYTGAGLDAEEVEAIWSDVPGEAFAGPGRTLRTVTYEFPQSAFPEEPRKTDTFTHRGRVWKVEDRTQRDDIGKWELVVADIGPAT
jgi:hypothetical protein